MSALSDEERDFITAELARRRADKDRQLDLEAKRHEAQAAREARDAKLLEEGKAFIAAELALRKASVEGARQRKARQREWENLQQEQLDAELARLRKKTT